MDGTFEMHYLSVGHSFWTIRVTKNTLSHRSVIWNWCYTSLHFRGLYWFTLRRWYGIRRFVDKDLYANVKHHSVWLCDVGGITFGVRY